MNPIAERVMKVPSLTFHVGEDSIVIAVKHDLIVRTQALAGTSGLREALSEVAEHRGTLAGLVRPPSDSAERDDFPRATSAPEGDGKQPDPDYEPGPATSVGEVEIWRLTDKSRNAIDEARRLRGLVEDERVTTLGGEEVLLPAVSPNHVAILCPEMGGCPAAPPKPAGAPEVPPFVPPPEERTVKVTVLDSGYISVEPPHRHLDERVTSVLGDSLNVATNPWSWKPDREDGLYTNAAGALDGISGHGTFIAGLISHVAPCTRLEVVALRNEEVELDGLDPAQQLGLFETEFAIAHTMLRRSHTDVIQCGFAFPTLDDYPSVPFAAVMAELRGPDAPWAGRVAVVAPAGNERSRSPYWPAALPDVIGVASTDVDGDARAWFSNWGEWCDCCARGQDVYSTFVHWDGPVEGHPLSEHFRGWARWDGTSFAAPKVAAAIARILAENPGLPPTEAWELLLGGAEVDLVTDATLSPYDNVTLPRIPEHG